MGKKLEEYHTVTLTRGKHGFESLVVKGSIKRWLRENNARPTKDPYRFVVRGWRCEICPISAEVIKTMEHVFNKKY